MAFWMCLECGALNRDEPIHSDPDGEAVGPWCEECYQPMELIEDDEPKGATP